MIPTEPFTILQVGEYYLDKRNFLIKIVRKENQHYISHLGQYYFRNGVSVKDNKQFEGLDIVSKVLVKEYESAYVEPNPEQPDVA